MLKAMIRQAFRNIAQTFITLMVLFVIVFVVGGGLAGCLVWELYRTGEIRTYEERMERLEELRQKEFPRPQMPDMPTAREAFEKYGIENWGLPE